MNRDTHENQFKVQTKVLMLVAELVKEFVDFAEHIKIQIVNSVELY